MSILWVVPQLQFIDRVDGVRDGVLLVLSSVVHRDRYPQCFFSSWLWLLQYIDKVVDVGDAVALWRLVKEFHIFFYVLALFAWNLDVIS